MNTAVLGIMGIIVGLGICLVVSCDKDITTIIKGWSKLNHTEKELTLTEKAIALSQRKKIKEEDLLVQTSEKEALIEMIKSGILEITIEDLEELDKTVSKIAQPADQYYTKILEYISLNLKIDPTIQIVKNRYNFDSENFEFRLEKRYKHNNKNVLIALVVDCTYYVTSKIFITVDKDTVYDKCDELSELTDNQRTLIGDIRRQLIEIKSNDVSMLLRPVTESI